MLHCDETRVQVLKEPGHDPSSQSWMWVQTGGLPDKPVTLFDYSTSRAQKIPLRLLAGYRGYLMTDNYAGYNAVAAQAGVECLACWAQRRQRLGRRNHGHPKYPLELFQRLVTLSLETQKIVNILPPLDI